MADHQGQGSFFDLTNADLHRYHITRRLGSGGMGEVYEAVDTLLKRKVALKRLLPRIAEDQKRREILLREARAVSALSHPNIAGIYDVFEVEAETFLVMELVTGEPLHATPDQPMPLDIFFGVARQCCEALEAAHQKRIIHGDLKPSNIFLDSTGHVKVLDFGLARWLSTNDATTMSSPSLGVSGEAFGTIQYLAPEVFRGKKYDQRRDLFAMGVIFYELTTGKHPFQADNFSAVIARVLNETPPAPSTLNSKVPTNLDHMIAGLLKKEPAERYESATRVLADLQLLERTPTALLATARSNFTSRLFHRVSTHTFSSITALFLVLLISGLFVWQQHLRKEPQTFAARSWILIADFQNSTGNPIFDQTLNEGLTVALQQSSHLNIFPRARVFEALKRMALKNMEFIDEPTAREICQREDLQILLTGSIRRSGQNYQITLRGIEPENGGLLFVEREEFHRNEDLFGRVDSLARRVRGQLGEPRARIQTARSLAKVTTPSLEALQHYSRASVAYDRGDMESARLLLLSALSRDQNFAMAHRLLTNVYLTVGDPKYYQHLQRAYELRNAVTEREQYIIEATYLAYRFEYRKAVEILKLLMNLYPDDEFARRTLASCYNEMGQVSNAIAELREVLRLRPYDADANRLLVLYLAYSNANENAIQAYQNAVKLGVKHPDLQWGLGMAYFGLGRLKEALEQFQLLEKEGGAYQAIGEIYDVRTKIYEGKFAEAIRQLNAGIDQDQKTGNKFPEILRRFLLARSHFVRGESHSVIEQLEIILTTGSEAVFPYDLWRAGDLYLRVEKPDKAAEMLKRLEAGMKTSPIPFMKSCYWDLKGEILLAKKNPTGAIQSFLKADAEQPLFISHKGLARAYDQIGNLKGAAVEWQRVIESRGEILRDDFPAEWVLAHLELARIQRRLHETEDAKRNYDQFLRIWQQADSLPVREQALQERKELTEH